MSFFMIKISWFYDKKSYFLTKLPKICLVIVLASNSLYAYTKTITNVQP